MLYVLTIAIVTVSFNINKTVL